MKISKIKLKLSALGTLLGCFILIFASGQTFAAASLSYSFDDTNRTDLLNTDFTEQVSAGGGFAYTNDGGIASSGALDANGTSAVWTTRQKIAPDAGESLMVSGYFYNASNSGFGAIGLSSTSGVTVNGSGVPATDNGLALVMHGGGYYFINDGSTESYNWDIGTDISVDNWWYFSLEAEPVGPGLFDVAIRLYPSDANGNLGTIASLKVLRNVASTALEGASNQPYAYLGKKDNRFSKIDGFGFSTQTSTIPEAPPIIFEEGSGISSDPYQINNCEDLQKIDTPGYLDKYYVLNNDIDCSMTNPESEDFDAGGTWGDENGFNPIGHDSDFSGNFDGNNKSINGLFIDTTNDRVGLFAETAEGSLVKDVTLFNVDITGDDGVGALVGLGFGTHDNCNISGGSVSGDQEVGGLIGGHNGWDTIENSSTDVTVTGNWAVGGLAGSNYGNIYDSNAYGPVTGTDTVGGLVGNASDFEPDNTEIFDSNAYGNVQGTTNVGGALGYVYQTDIEGISSFGDITIVDNESADPYRVGGLIGYAEYFSLYGSTSNSYVTGDIVGEVSMSEIGGLIGYAYEGDINTVGANGDVTGFDFGQNVGGLIGYSEWTDLFYAYSTGTVEVYDNAGGLIGYSYETDLEESFSLSDVSARGDVGGLVAINDDSVIVNSYARGDVDTYDGAAGGLVSDSAGEIINSYATGSVSAGDEAGRTAGLLVTGNTTFSSFWDIETTGQSDPEAPNDTDGQTGKNTSQLTKTDDLYTTDTTVGLTDPWDFVGRDNQDTSDEDIWTVNSTDNDGYPCLTWAAEDSCLMGGSGSPDSDSQELRSAEDNSLITLEQTGCGSIDTSGTKKEIKLGKQDAGYDYPVGLVNFKLFDCGSGGTAHITLTFTGKFNLDDISIRKFNSSNNSFANLTADNSNLTTSVTTLGGKKALKVEYDITDGGALDEDGQENAEISDPVGLALLAVEAPNTGLGLQ